MMGRGRRIRPGGGGRRRGGGGGRKGGRGGGGGDGRGISEVRGGHGRIGVGVFCGIYFR